MLAVVTVTLLQQGQKVDTMLCFGEVFKTQTQESWQELIKKGSFISRTGITQALNWRQPGSDQ